MNHRTLTALLFTAAIGLGTQAMAQDSTTKPPDATSPSTAGQMQQQEQPSDQGQGQKHAGMSKSQRAFMKDCMSKAKQANNGTSEMDMHKSCRDQMKANVDQPSKPVTPAN
jgi:hypothetical protein